MLPRERRAIALAHTGERTPPEFLSELFSFACFNINLFLHQIAEKAESARVAYRQFPLILMQYIRSY